MRYDRELRLLLTYVEQHAKESLEPEELERLLHFSRRHIRTIFREATGVPLMRYVASRKLAHASMEILLSQKSLTEIAYDYGFESYDTFTRAFRREVGVNPSDYKGSGIICGRRQLCGGVYGPFILGARTGPLRMITEEEMDHTTDRDSCVLYGVPRVFYGREQDGGNQATPFPMCLQAVLSYLGQHVSYTELMAATGAAFRLRWNRDCWDPAAVDIRNIFPEHNRPFELGFQWAGRACAILERETVSREEALRLIRREIDAGRPLIALGIVGPPEASVVTGYSEGGAALHGWSLFQDSPAFSGVEKDESGYFVSRDWWGENTDAIIAVGEQAGERLPLAKLLENARYLLTEPEISSYEGRCGVYYGGQAAYRAWREALLDDTQFPPELGREQLEERYGCLCDAACMAGEGRACAAAFFRELARRGLGQPEWNAECAARFQAVSDCIQELLNAAQGGPYGFPMELLLERETRRRLAGCVERAAAEEERAVSLLAEMPGRPDTERRKRK